MAASLRDLRRKIKSIQGTKKLTQAMQMVAASRMQKAIQAAETSRDYANLAWDIIKNIRSGTDINQHFLLSARPVKNIAIILVTSNRGLCGGLNAQIIRKLTIYIKEMQEKNVNIDLVTMGNKGKLFVSRFYKDMLVADFPLPEQVASYSDITPISKMLLDDYQNKKYDHVYILYNHFVSTLRQEPVHRQLLPIPSIEITEEYQNVKAAKPETNNQKSEANSQKNGTEYKFEPDIQSVLNTLLPNVIKTQLYQILLEAGASEQSARMVAMKNATDNAGDLIDDLALTYNSLRQAVITKEITEISAGAEALRA